MKKYEYIYTLICKNTTFCNIKYIFYIIFVSLKTSINTTNFFNIILLNITKLNKK